MEQIIFLDQTLLKLYGFTGIDDYKNEISIKDLKNTQHLEQINQHITTITELFKTGTLNLSRKNYQIDTETLSLALLRNLLQQANIPYEIVHKSYGNVTRLISPNILLMNYINQKKVKDVIHKQKTQKPENRKPENQKLETQKMESSQAETQTQDQVQKNETLGNNQEKYEEKRGKMIGQLSAEDGLSKLINPDQIDKFEGECHVCKNQIKERNYMCIPHYSSIFKRTGLHLCDDCWLKEQTVVDSISIVDTTAKEYLTKSQEDLQKKIIDLEKEIESYQAYGRYKINDLEIKAHFELNQAKQKLELTQFQLKNLQPATIDLIRHTCQYEPVTKMRSRFFYDVPYCVRSIKLINLPTKYTYVLFLNSTRVGCSTLIDGYQTFDFELMNDPTQNQKTDYQQKFPDYRSDYHMLDIYRNTAVGNFTQVLSKTEKRVYIEFGRIDHISIDVIKTDPYDSFHIFNGKTDKFFQDEYQFEIEGITIANEKKQHIKETKTYPMNRMHEFFSCGSVEKIMIDPHLENTYLLLDGDVKLKFQDGQIDFKQVPEEIMAKIRHHGSFEENLGTYFPNSFELNKNWVNFSRHNDIIILVENPDIQQLEISTVKYNMWTKSSVTLSPTWLFNY